MRVAIIGLPFAGKSTVFKALVGKQIQPKTAASGKFQLNIGTLEVKDERLEKLAKVVNSGKITFPRISLVDLGRLAEPAAAAKVETAHVKEFDALIAVIGVFSSLDSIQDLKDIESELILADMQVIQTRVEKINKERKGRPKREEDPELSLLVRCQQALEQESMLKGLNLGSQELKMLAGFQLLTLKPMIIVANVSEEQLNAEKYKDLEKEAAAKNLKFLSLCAKLEAEIEELPEDERPAFLKEMGLEALGKDRFIPICLEAQNKISFFTVVGKEARAWLVSRGTSALEAAGAVHSDMQRGFIRAEVTNYKDLIECGSFTKAKEKGLLRLESKEYIVQDGDIINFKFSV